MELCEKVWRVSHAFSFCPLSALPDRGAPTILLCCYENILSYDLNVS